MSRHERQDSLPPGPAVALVWEGNQKAAVVLIVNGPWVSFPNGTSFDKLLFRSQIPLTLRLS